MRRPLTRAKSFLPSAKRQCPARNRHITGSAHRPKSTACLAMGGFFYFLLFFFLLFSFIFSCALPSFSVLSCSPLLMLFFSLLRFSLFFFFSFFRFLFCSFLLFALRDARFLLVFVAALAPRSALSRTPRATHKLSMRAKGKDAKEENACPQRHKSPPSQGPTKRRKGKQHENRHRSRAESACQTAHAVFQNVSGARTEFS